MRLVKACRIGVLVHGHGLSRARLEEERAKSTTLAVAWSLFLMLIGAAFVFGGHAAIDPLLRSAFAAREAKGIGDVVYTMPDGVFCRHMSFDNMTAEVSEGALERCTTDIARRRPLTAPNFTWGGR